MTTSADREKALEAALAQIDRQFGKGSVMRLGSDERPPVPVIPTGSIALDVALGIGGLPRGRIIEIYGPESSGKTTLTLHAIANVQAAGGIAAFVDAEHALDPEYAKALGVDIDQLLVSQPDTGEQALEIADMLVRSAMIDLSRGPLRFTATPPRALMAPALHTTTSTGPSISRATAASAAGSQTSATRI